MTNHRTEAGKAVAIVGIGCRFPGSVESPDDFWRLLSGGVDAISEIPSSRIDLSHFFDPRPATPGRMMTRWGGFLDHIDEFDPGFFGMSPREAERMDPQQRLVLEAAWEALEDAGIDAKRVEGSNAGVFVGQWLNDFEARLFVDPEGVDFQMTTGSGRYATSGRISYVLGLRGPSITLDTACSSSLAAVHFAVRSIRDGQCSLALAGGVNVILQPHISVAYSQSRMMAPDGRCKFGDASGDGYVRSEGAALIVLKALDQALADGDRIYAVVRGTAVNNDGRSSGSMGTPSRVGQEELLRSAYRDAGLAPGRVGYVEAHGTGTRAGDPVELAALGAVLGEGRAPGQRAYVGSVKTNFGHTEGAAGVAGLIKVALALHHGAIPPNLHFKTPNPTIPWADAPFQIPTSLQPWPASDGPKVGGVSAFGIAGTNAHIVLEQATGPASRSELPAARDLAILPLSAASPEALHAVAGRYADLIEGAQPVSLQDVCWNAALTRAALDQRAVFVAADRAGMADALRRYAAGEVAAAEGAVHSAARPKIAFVLPGQGAQWTGMARELASREPEFRSALEQCDAAARKYVDWSIVEQLAAEPGTPTYKLDQIDVIQPVLVALAIAYARLWRLLGVVPDAVVGHSMGEVGAACIAGVLDLDQAMRIICRRSALMRRTSGQGAMALVDLAMDEARARIAGHEHQISVAVSNSPRSSVISGDPEAVRLVMAGLEADQVFCRLVKVDVASHSPQMEPLAAELKAELADLRPQPAHTPIYSTVLARRAEGEEFGADYWARNMRQPVMFGQAVGKLIDDGVTVFVELGPHPVLLPSIAQTAQASSVEALTIACGRREESEQATFFTSLGALWAGGVEVDWRLALGAVRPRISLPFYPWQRERHWLPAADIATVTRGHGRAVLSRHPVLGQGVELAGSPTGALWAPSLEPGRLSAWFEHALHGSTVLPASAYLELAMAAARALVTDGAMSVHDLSFDRALHLQADAATALQLQASADGQGGLQLEFQSHTEAGWVRHAGALLGPASSPAVTRFDASARDRLSQQVPLSGEVIYARLQSLGAHFGPGLRRIARAWLSPGEALAQITLDAPLADVAGDRFCIAPELLDTCFQLMVLLAPGGELWLPTELNSAHCLRAPRGEVWLHAQLRAAQAGDARPVIDATLADADGVVLELQGLLLQQLGNTSTMDARDVLFDVRWTALAASPEPAPAASLQWLLVADRAGLAEVLAAHLKREGDAVVLLKDAAHLLPTLQEALQAAPAGGRTNLVDMRALDLDHIDEGYEAALFALLQPAQWLGRLPPSADVRLWWVTRDAQVALANDAASLSLAQAPIQGLAAVLAVEQGDRWGGTVDLDPAVSPAEAIEGLRQAIAANAGAVALRGGQCLQARLEHCPVAASALPVWRKDASYLLTGGLGGVGAHVARWWVNEGVRHLVVMSRTPLPSRAAWSALDAASPGGRAVATVRELESLGAHVQHVAVDVADDAGLRTWLAQFQAEDRPPIRGVFHLAGITDDKLVHDLDAPSLRAVLRPKLRGAANLHALLPELDAFVLFSSMASLLPQAGQASYAAANAFLDALARRRLAGGQHALSIGWGVWAQTGVMQGEVGRLQLEELTRQGIGSFAPSQALSLLGDALRLPVAQVAVLPIDWRRLRANLSGRRMPLVQDLLDEVRVDAQAAADAQTAMPEVPTDPVERRRAMERAVRDVVGRVLKLAPARIDARKPLGSMGLTSLMALELRNRLEPLHGKPLSATLAWNYPTVEALVGFLCGPEDAAPAAPVVTTPAPSTEVAEVLGEVNELSDEDAARLLRKRR